MRGFSATRDPVHLRYGPGERRSPSSAPTSVASSVSARHVEVSVTVQPGRISHRYANRASSADSESATRGASGSPAVCRLLTMSRSTSSVALGA